MSGSNEPAVLLSRKLRDISPRSLPITTQVRCPFTSLRPFSFLIIPTLALNEAFHQMMARDMLKGLRYTHIVLLRTLILAIKMNCRAACNGDEREGAQLAFKFLWRAVTDYCPELKRFHVPVADEDLNLNLMARLNEIDD